MCKAKDAAKTKLDHLIDAMDRLSSVMQRVEDRHNRESTLEQITRDLPCLASI